MILAEAVTAADMEAVRQLRAAVFIDEQGVPAELEWDGRDAEARHLLAREAGVAVATLRWRVLDDVGKIERVCVARPCRGRKLGAALMRRVLTELRATPGVRRARLGAQLSVTGFYEGFGFAAFGPVYDEAGIPHRDMELRLHPAAGTRPG